MNDIERALLEGHLFTVGYTTGSIVSAGNEPFGIEIGAYPVMYMTRIYTATVSSISVVLYEEGFSGGVAAGQGNRNFTNTSGNAPASHYSGITPAGGGIVRASALLQGPSATGASALSVVTESEFYVLKPNTKYVVRFVNNAAGAGTVNFRWTFKSANTCK